MKRIVISVTATLATLFAAALLWAGGMGGGSGGGMGGGMMGGGGHMMDSYGNGRMGSSQYYDQDSAQRRHAARERVQEDYDHDMRRLDRQIRQKEQDLKAENLKKSPDKDKIEKLRRDLSKLNSQYDDRRAEFESRWGRDDRQ